MEDIRMKINVVALIAAIGSILAVAGAALSYTDFTGTVSPLFLIGFVAGVIAALINVKPSVNDLIPLVNIILSVIVLVESFAIYVLIAESVINAPGMASVGMGPWLALSGSMIYLIFSISDLVYKKDRV